MNICFRVYNNGDLSGEEHISDVELSEWTSYNYSYRPGCAQVVNGKVTYRGYLGADQLRHIDPTATDKIPNMTVSGAVEILRHVYLDGKPSSE